MSVCKQHEWPYGVDGNGGPYCVWCELLRNESLQQQLKAATWRRDRLEMALTALCSAAEGVVAEFADFGTDEIMELDELLYTVRRILQGMGEEMPGAVQAVATPPTAAPAKETP